MTIGVAYLKEDSPVIADADALVEAIIAESGGDVRAACAVLARSYIVAVQKTSTGYDRSSLLGTKLRPAGDEGGRPAL